LLDYSHSNDPMEDFELHEQLFNSDKEWIDGCVNMDPDGFIELVVDIISNDENTIYTKELWKSYFYNMRDKQIINSDEMYEIVRKKDFNSQVGKSVHDTYQAARYATHFFRNRTSSRGLKDAAHIAIFKKNSMIKNKMKSTRNMIMNYKLIYNRCLLITERLQLTLDSKQIDLNTLDQEYGYYKDGAKLTSEDITLLKQLTEDGLVSLIEKGEDGNVFGSILTKMVGKSEDETMFGKSIDLVEDEMKIKENLNLSGTIEITQEQIEFSERATLRELEMYAYPDGIDWEDFEDCE